jgi:hypothetical protein
MIFIHSKEGFASHAPAGEAKKRNEINWLKEAA